MPQQLDFKHFDASNLDLLMNNKLFAVAASAVIAIGALSSVLRADVIAYDNFDYADGSLVGNGGWANHSGTTGDLQVLNNQVVVQHGAPSEDANLSFSSGAGDIFFGIDFSVTSTEAISGDDFEYFAHFKNDGFGFSARLDIVAATSGGDFTVGIASNDSTADATWATDLTFGNFYRAVVRFDQPNNQAQLWVDATNESDVSILGDDKADPGNTITQFALRQSDSDQNETVTVDNLVIGQTFQDVVTPFTPVPEPSGLLVLGLFGFAGLARRRRS